MSFLKTIKNSIFKSKKSSNINHNNFKNSISDDIFNLLWFTDGPYKNYDIDEHVKAYKKGPIELTFSNSNSIEPSALYVDLPIKKPIDIDNIEHPSYFPNYESLNPEQKWIYLNWLKNPYESIDIGYVFIFYYGLERHLVLGDFDKAFDVILKLREAHNNNSFRVYSDNALILSTILHNRPDKLNSFLDYIDKSDDNINIRIYLLTKYIFKQNLNSTDIIKLSKDVGFTNHRYIKMEYELFKNILEDTLIKMCGEPFYSLTGFKLENSTKSKFSFLANVSFDSNERTVSIPDLTNDSSFKDSIFSVLSMTHEEVKIILREQRKKNRN